MAKPSKAKLFSAAVARIFTVPKVNPKVKLAAIAASTIILAPVAALVDLGVGAYRFIRTAYKSGSILTPFSKKRFDQGVMSGEFNVADAAVSERPKHFFSNALRRLASAAIVTLAVLGFIGALIVPIPGIAPLYAVGALGLLEAAGIVAGLTIAANFLGGLVGSVIDFLRRETAAPVNAVRVNNAVQAIEEKPQEVRGLEPSISGQLDTSADLLTDSVWGEEEQGVERTMRASKSNLEAELAAIKSLNSTHHIFGSLGDTTSGLFLPRSRSIQQEQNKAQEVKALPISRSMQEINFQGANNGPEPKMKVLGNFIKSSLVHSLFGSAGADYFNNQPKYGQDDQQEHTPLGIEKGPAQAG